MNHEVPDSNSLERFLPERIWLGVDSAGVAGSVAKAMLRAYQDGFQGAFLRNSDAPPWAAKIARYEHDAFLAEAPFPKFSEYAAGLVSGKGKRAVNFNYAMRLPGFNAFVIRQDYGNCVFASVAEIMNHLHGVRRLALGLPDEWPARHGTVWYSTRGHCSQGASLSQSAKAMVTLGLQFRMKYLDGKYDFTDENTDEKYGNSWCRSGPPADLVAVTKQNLHKSVSHMDEVTADTVRDVLFNGGAIHHGSNATGTSGDPVGGIQRIGGHAQAAIGYDDTDEFRDWYKQTTGRTIAPDDFAVINDNTWGPGWIRVTNWPLSWGLYPEGVWVTTWKDARKWYLTDECYAYMPDSDAIKPHEITWVTG